MKALKTNIYLKISIIFFIGIILLIPAMLIKDLIREREYTQYDAISEVSSKWGEEQTISGPYISVPYTKFVKQYSQKDSTNKIVQITEYLHFLPTELNISGEIKPEKRERGIYEIVVYNSTLNIEGSFNDIKFSDIEIPMQNIQFDKAFLSIGINDLRGIEETVSLMWNNELVMFNSGSVTNDIINNGVNADVKISHNDSSVYKFNFSLSLKGSQKLYFTPVGKITDIKIKSDWNNPSFNGAFLPDKREVTETGFNANWNILHLNRNYPQKWISNNFNPDSSAFGIDLLLPVDSYQKTTRAIKYAILFIAFTFLVFFFVEIFNKVFIHPIQYILVGIALVVFFSLLLSISEHINFNYAFIVSALATLLLISGYVKAIIKSNKIMGLISGILFILYSFIFIIIQLQDYALLIGSIGIFIILVIVMYLSRKIDWYNIKIEE